MMNTQAANTQEWWCLNIGIDYKRFSSVEELADFLCSLGAGGLEELTDNSVNCYVPGALEPFIKKLEQAQLDYISTCKIPNQNWLQNCKELHHPIRINKLILTPVTDKNEAPLTSDNNTILIQPGLGFGTGHHTTTQLMLELLQSEQVLKLNPKDVADVGTGSSVLAIAAAKLYQSTILAIDTDPLALTNAETNIDLNQQSNNIWLKEGTLESSDGTFDLIMANIYAEVLVDYCELFDKALTAQGLLLLSGVFDHKRELIIEKYKNWQLVQELYKQPENEHTWYAFLLSK